MFPRSPVRILKDIGSEQVWQIQWVILTVKHTFIKRRDCELYSSDYFEKSRSSKGQYLLLILNLTARRSSSQWTMSSPSKFKVLLFLYGLSLIDNSIFTKKLSFSRTFITETLMGILCKRLRRQRSRLHRPCECNRFPRMFQPTSCSIELKQYERCCQGRNMGLIQECSPMILQELSFLWVKRSDGSWGVKEIINCFREIVICHVAIRGAR